MHASVSPLAIRALHQAAALPAGTSFKVVDHPGSAPEESLRCLTTLFESKFINAWVHRTKTDNPVITQLEVSGITPTGRRWLAEALA